MSRPGASRWPRVHEGRLNEAAQHGANFERDRGDGGAIRKGAPRLDRHADPGGAVDAFLAERLRIVERVRSLVPDIVTGRSASALVVATQTLLRRRSTSDPIDESAWAGSRRSLVRRSSFPRHRGRRSMRLPGGASTLSRDAEPVEASRRGQRDGNAGNGARGIMIGDVLTTGPDESTGEAARRMVEKRIHRLPVVEEGRLVGIVSAFDFMRFHAEAG